MADHPTSLDTPTDLSNTAPVADALNGALADCFALYLKTKNFHWHMSGPQFRDHHLLLDDQADQIFAATDAMAERVRKIGRPTLRSIGDVARHQSIKDNDKEFVGAADMLFDLRDDNLALIARLRLVKDAADAAHDNATSGIVDGWTDEAEQRVWFLFEAAGAR